MDEAETIEARDALSRIRSSGFLDGAPKLEAFLRFVVQRQLEGGDINAYAIAVNALDRPESFDPQADPVVRVFAGRLRSALAEYYEGPGRHDPVWIDIPKGTYRPQFARAPGVPPISAMDAGKSGRFPRLGMQKRGVAAFALLIACVISYGVYFGNARDAAPDRIALTNEAEIAFPVVEIGPFDAGKDRARRDLLTGIRQQLVIDLSQFRTLRVRDMPAKGKEKTALKKSDFHADGRLVKYGGQDLLEIAVRDAARDEVIWNQTLDVPENDAEYQELLLTTVRAIASRLAGISGIVQVDAIRRLEERRDKLANSETSDYECMVKFYVFGQHRSPGSEQAARQCLAELTARGSRDSMIWAFFALIRHMDWVRHAGDGGAEILDESLDAAHRAIELDPSNANAHEFAAMNYAAMGEMEAARMSFERALVLNPSKPDFYVHYGVFFIQQGDWERGVELVRKGIDLSPSPPGWMYLSLTGDAFRRDEFDEALRVAQLVIDAGDRRGYMPALAAAIALGDRNGIERYLAGYRAAYPGASHQALREFAKFFRDQALIAKYEKTLARVLTL